MIRVPKPRGCCTVPPSINRLELHYPSFAITKYWLSHCLLDSFILEACLCFQKPKVSANVSWEKPIMCNRMCRVYSHRLPLWSFSLPLGYSLSFPLPESGDIHPEGEFPESSSPKSPCLWTQYISSGFWGSREFVCLSLIIIDLFLSNCVLNLDSLSCRQQNSGLRAPRSLLIVACHLSWGRAWIWVAMETMKALGRVRWNCASFAGISLWRA